MAPSLEESKTRSRSVIYEQIPIIGAKFVKIGPTDPEIICLRAIIKKRQEAFEKCWAHSPLRAAARRLFYIAIHQVSLLSHAATFARRLRIKVHNNIDNNDNDSNDNA